MKAIGRRRALKTAATTLAGLAVSWIAAPAAWAERFFRQPPWMRKSPYWGFAVDIAKCIGCGKCADACKTENDVPRHPFYFRTWIERYTIRKSGETTVESPNGGIDGFDPP